MQPRAARRIEPFHAGNFGLRSVVFLVPEMVQHERSGTIKGPLPCVLTSAARSSLLAPFAIAALGACGGYSPTAPLYPTGPTDQTPVPAATVQATPSEQFTPGRVNLTVGGTVTFAFGSLAHNVFFDNDPTGAPDNIAAASSNKSVTLTFNTKGTYAYNCHIPSGHAGHCRSPVDVAVGRIDRASVGGIGVLELAVTSHWFSATQND